MKHLWTLLVIVGATQATQGQKNITAATGQSITLSCRAPNRNIIVVEWSRADLGEEYVFLYRDDRSLQDNQRRSFKNRVDLQDRQMKDGDVSLILKDVTINDNGRYECRVVQGVRQPMRLVNSIYLRVVDPPGQTGGDTEDGGKEDGGKEAGGEKSGSVGLIIGLSVVAVVVFTAVVGVLIYKTYKKCCQDSDHPPTESQIEMSERFLNSESPADEQRDRSDLEANNSHQHSTRIPDVTLTVENELLPPQETAGLLPECDIRVQ